MEMFEKTPQIIYENGTYTNNVLEKKICIACE